MPKSINCILWLPILACLALPADSAEQPWITFSGDSGPGQGKHIVLVSGDEEYRSEEALPQLAKILAVHHGFKCTVLFAINPETGEIDPNNLQNIPGLETLQDADLMIIFTRFRNLPPEQMQHIDAYLKSGRPVIGMRTATHAFNQKEGDWAHYGNGYSGNLQEWADGFGRLVLGEKWIRHHGAHKKESTRGVVAEDAKDHPIVRGIAPKSIWGDTDVYGVRLPLPGDSRPIVYGQVLTGMNPDDPPVDGPKNDPMMPVAWTKSYQLPGGKKGQVFNTTMGAATDLAAEGTRRMLVNATYWILGLADQIPPQGTKVDLVGEFKPTMYGFGGFKKGVKPSDHALAPADQKSSQSNGGAAPLQLKKGVRISLIGNTLGERMQHVGWLETLLQSRHPEHELTVRNLCFSADELTIRQRSAGFGEPDEWLSKMQTDVVFAFFGFNESFAGEAGLPKFRQDLENFISHTLGQKYNGAAPPELILFSPIACENLHDPNLPDGIDNNRRIALYTRAMAEVAAEKGVRFVDLFSSMAAAYEKASQPLSINGIHLNTDGNRELALIIDKALFGPRTAPLDIQQLEPLRQAVLDKNFYWFHRYRTTDGYSSYGGRSYLKFVNDQTNREVMFRELEILDQMTANRDKVVWAAAQGKSLQPDDSNLPDFIPVITNKPGAGVDGRHLFLSGADAIQQMTIAKDLQVELFASEEMFPELINPVQMAWDTRGRLWVAAWPTYPHWKPGDEMNDKLLILEDTDDDGRADKCITFADKLHNPTGFEFWNGGVLVSMAPDLIFIKDTDGDDRADVRERILHGLDSADTHHTANSFVIGPDGGLYFQEGVFHRTQVETPYGPVRNTDACVWRFDPRSWKLERYVAYGFANPHGHVFDRWGQDIIHDGTGAVPYHGAVISGYVEFPRKHDRAPAVYQQRTRPCPATEILSSRHFPEDFQDNLLVQNVIGFQGILRYRLKDDGSSFGADEMEPLLSSSDPNFRPVDLEIAPDGSLYFVDWQNPIIGHMQHNLRDPSRDQQHGRVYRVTYKGRDRLQPIPIARRPIEELLDLLDEPENRVRYRARLELSGRDSRQVIDAVAKWIDRLDAGSDSYEHLLLEALWLHQQHHHVNRDLLLRLLSAQDFRARAAATRVLSYWRDEISDTLDLLRERAADPHPRVRLEAIRAASFLRQPEAIEVVVIAQQHPSDKFLAYTSNETLKTLDPIFKEALASGTEVAMRTEAGERFLLRNFKLEQLLARQPSPAVFRELLDRPGVQDEHRQRAIRELARLEQKSELHVLLGVIEEIDARPNLQETSVVTDLVRLLTMRPADELSQARDEIVHLALEAKQPVLRQVAFAALIGIDRSPQDAWELASKKAGALHDLVVAVPLISDPSQRAALYDQLLGLLDSLPQGAASPASAPGGARFVRIELPRRGTLTLAEVEVWSAGRNVAPQGTARQINTAFNGDAKRAIDGNTQGAFGAGGQTHTQENTNNPWWELDLGAEYPVESITVYNRTDGDLGNRLKDFSLIVLNNDRKELFRSDRNPAPKVKSTFELEIADPATALRRAVMDALTAIRGREPEVFKLLADYIVRDQDRLSAVQALQRIPRRFWPKDQARPLLNVMLPHIRSIPVAARTSQAALDKLEFADSLASLLPVDEARQVRAELRELGVRVIRVGTLPERMAYDKELIAVAAGKPVEFIFENIDLMPHNFVITQPGALEEVGLLAEATAQQPGALERQYIPPSKKLLLASNLLLSREVQRISWTAPEKPGVYPYVCTYPGHWRRMYGALYVVEDLDAYLADPEAYLAAHPLPILDDLLKDRRPRTEWKFEDLAEAVEHLHSGRSFGNAVQMFQAANCVACHKLNAVGREFGPDLAKIDPPKKPVELLKEILDPSAKINEKYQTWVIVTVEGRVVTGMITEETAEVVKIIENPLAKAEPVVIRKADIDERQKSDKSIMPKGLLDKLTRDEILDLIAYVAAKGNEQDPLFQGGRAQMHHHHGPASSPKHQHDH